PSDFNLSYQNNRWFQDNFGWGAHGTAQAGNLLLPGVIRVSSFGGLVEMGGTNGIPSLGQMPLWYNRSSQAGPWDATMLWYGTPDQDFTINKVSLNQYGYASRRTLATLDHVGAFGGGDWHPMFFGDLLIYARSGSTARDGVVVYRLSYHNFDDADPSNDAVTPQFVGSLPGGFQGYWPNLFSDGTGLYVIGSTTNILVGADITQAATPGSDGTVTLAASLTVPNFTNASYPVYQDQFGFIHNRKFDMTRFLAGDANPIVLTLDEVGTGVNTSQMSLALGNLWLTGGYPIPGFNQGMGVWVQQQAPDTNPPRVTYHIPQANRTNYPRHAPLSFLLHEHPRNGGPRNGIDFTVRPVGPGDTLGSAVPGFLIQDFSGNLTFTPDAALAAETTYQVNFLSDPANQIGFRDAAGNYIEPYSFRFSTGGGINSTAPPVFTGVTADVYQPAPGNPVNVTATASGTGTLEYRFNFDGTWSAWSASASASHSYATAGRPRVLVQVRDAAGNLATQSLSLLVMTPPAAGPRPTQSSTITVGDDTVGGNPPVRRVWCVNQDADTVSVLDAVTGAKVAEHAVGQNPRNIARDALGRYWVTCHRSDELRVLNADGSTHATIPLAYGAAPFGIAPSPDGQTLFVTLFGSGQVQRYSAANPAAAPVSQNTFATPRAIAVSANGQRVLVTRFLSPDLEAEISEFAGTSANLALVRTIRLSSANSTDNGDRAAGVPNYLTSIAISPDGTRAAVTSKQDNIQRGTLFGVGNLTHETTVRAVVSFLDLTTNEEIRHTRRDFDNSDSPTAAAFTPLGDTLLVALQGNNNIVGLDMLGLAPVDTMTTPASTYTSPAVLSLDVSTGLAPQGICIDSVSNRLFSQDFMGRSVTVRQAAPLLVENRTTLPLIATTATVSAELLPADVLLGKRIFYNAADARMSADSYISCASCHVDGGHDGRVWDFTGRGEGLRRTTDLRGRSGMAHGNVHWSGNFDEIQDFEHDIRGAFGGNGFLNLTPQQFAAQHPSPASGKSGLSNELDALAAYVTSLTPEHTPRSPSRNSNGTLTTEAARGRNVFLSQNCASCHSGEAFTNSALTPINTPSLANVGTQSTLSGLRLSQTLPGIDTPSLHGLHATRVYLHHGQAATLGDVFAYSGGTLRLASSAQLLTTVNANAVGVSTDNPAEGGGGFFRGALGGTSVFIGDEAGAATPPGLRFSNVDGGPGGAARIAIRYVKQYAGGTALLRVNGAQQTLTVQRQYPDNSWQTSGWLWLTADATLTAGASNTIEILRGNGDVQINAVLVSHAADLATTQPHRLVQSLSAGDRSDLLAYLRQIDGRDANGTPLAPPVAPAPQPPSIISEPSGVTLAVGNSLSFTVAVSGAGPFHYQWRRGTTAVGSDSPTFEIASVQLSDAGSYTVTVTNAQGEATTTPAVVTVNTALAITTSALPRATAGLPYSATLDASGGVSARTWSRASGTLPLGLALSSSGQLSGTPAASAQAVLHFHVADSSGSDTRQLSLDIAPTGWSAQDPDLLLHYTFDEGSGNRVWDSARGTNNHSTDVPGAHWVADGRFGGAFYASDGSTFATPFIPEDQSDLDFNPRAHPFTISVWVRTSAQSGYNTIIGKDRPVSPYDVQYRLWMTNSGSSLQGINGGQYGSVLNVGASPMNNGQWHLVTLVNFFDGATWRTRMYYDDGTVFNQFSTGAGGIVPGLMRVGETTRGGNHWRGHLDDLRIYRRALSQAEIATLYAPPPTQSFAQWLLANLSAEQIAHTALLLPDADADANGRANALEFALGNAALSPLTLELLGPPGARIAQLTFTRNSLARGLTLIVESTQDFTTWTPLATSVNGATPTGTATLAETGTTLRTVTLQVPASSVPTFYRMRVVME
ncbi:MAG: LamG-like jellyroll fold domain-containing protein, partial [Roseimicrobium sp.]